MLVDKREGKWTKREKKRKMEIEYTKRYRRRRMERERRAKWGLPRRFGRRHRRASSFYDRFSTIFHSSVRCLLEKRSIGVRGERDTTKSTLVSTREEDAISENRRRKRVTNTTLHMHIRITNSRAFSRATV